jgi:GR25 family glycosyltransferase involved in LPS biosynthesis
VNGTTEVQEENDEVIVRGRVRVPIDRALSLSIRGRQLGKCQIGCAMSHLLLWQELAESAEPAFLIMEDDACIRQPQFDLAMQNLPAPADVVYLQDEDLRFNSPPHEHQRYNEFFYRTYDGVAHTHGYIIYREYARRLVTGFRLAHASDGALARSYRGNRDVRVYHMYEPCVCLTPLVPSPIGRCPD